MHGSVLANDNKYHSYETDELGPATTHRHNKLIPYWGENRNQKIGCGAVSIHCKVSFLNGVMRVNDSTGIKPDQILSVNTGKEDPVVTVAFRDSKGNKHLAMFAFVHVTDARHFMHTVFAFWSGFKFTEADK